MPLTLVILAAGLGSRFGGPKQVAPLGPGGATLMDYSVYDAERAGFERVVFVIRPDMAEWGRERASRRSGLPSEMVYQRPDDLPAGFSLPPGREKPWGTAHALRAAREAVATPFAALNADDFYGRAAFAAAAEFLAGDRAHGDHGLIGYRLDGTLSEAGGVSRALLEPGPDGALASIGELRDLRSDYGGMVRGQRQGMPILVPGEALVSMNFWLFSPTIFEIIEDDLTDFLAAAPGPRDECFLPEVVQRAISSGRARVSILTPASPWCGVTYPDDVPGVRARLAALTAAGEYPPEL